MAHRGVSIGFSCVRPMVDAIIMMVKLAALSLVGCCVTLALDVKKTFYFAKLN